MAELVTDNTNDPSVTDQEKVVPEVVKTKSPGPLPGKKAAPQDKPQEVIRSWVIYRKGQLEYENAHQSVSPIGGGNVFRGERQKIIGVFLDELEQLATWLDNGNLEFVPPMTNDQKQQWRFARDHGAEVPAHILAQLDVTK